MAHAIELPCDMEGNLVTAQELFGCNTFSFAVMQERLPPESMRNFLDTIEHGKALEKGLADQIANAVLTWAEEQGATHFCHWFHPMTGSTAEKHDAFFEFNQSEALAKFTGAQLIQSEPDASSFPSGGMRTTFEARGYTAWDPTSPMFIMEGINGATLCIPSAFVSYHGDALDKKTPLLRSMEYINQQAVRLCHLLGHTDTDRVIATAGPEQEYFLTDKAYVAFRSDLKIAGRSLVGSPAPKGQSLDDHYFGSIPKRALAFMHELELELYKLAVPAKTRHNEVAPTQFELAVQYSEANLAADHNQLVMELIKKVADRHDFTALLHEKPFAGVNGSGKHLNWSLADNQGRNLLEPGDNPSQNLRFLAFLAAVLDGVHNHAGLLRAAIASHGNDFRLGANEAPPAIISVFLGEQLTAVCDALVSGEQTTEKDNAGHIELGVARMPQIARDNTDRNRTSPFAFTGNKFEFRAVGSQSSISFPLMVVNTVIAKGISNLCEMIEANGNGKAGLIQALRDSLAKSSPIRFEGNNYSDDWVNQAEKLGLPNLKKTPEALEQLRSPSVQALFEESKVLSKAELESRYHVKVELYNSTVEIEFEALSDIIDHHILPAALEERKTRAEGIMALKGAGITPSSGDLDDLKSLSGDIEALRNAYNKLKANMQTAHALDNAPKAVYLASNVVTQMETIRQIADGAEDQIADSRWTLPRYSEMLFHH